MSPIIVIVLRFHLRKTISFFLNDLIKPLESLGRKYVFFYLQSLFVAILGKLIQPQGSVPNSSDGVTI